MTKKDAWKQSIRAEVAAALQSAHQPTPTAAKPVAPTKKAAVASATPSAFDMGPIRRDLRRIGFVTGTLLVILVGITIAQSQTQFLTDFYDEANKLVTDRLTDQPQPVLTDDTSPVPNP